MGLYTTKNTKMTSFFKNAHFNHQAHASSALAVYDRNACVVHAGLASLGVAPGALAMQLRWPTSDRTCRFGWLRSRANPKPRQCDMASAWGERHRRRAPDFTSQSAEFRTQITRECWRRRPFSTPFPKRTTTNGAAAGRRPARRGGGGAARLQRRAPRPRLLAAFFKAMRRG